MSLVSERYVYTYDESEAEPGTYIIQLGDGTFIGRVRALDSAPLGRVMADYELCLPILTRNAWEPSGGWPETVQIINLEHAARQERERSLVDTVTASG